MKHGPAPAQTLEDSALSRRVRMAFWIAGLGFGIVETIASRFSMGADGVSYLDLGRAFWTGDWNAAINGYWSPLYAFLLGVAVGISHVPLHWESNLVHVVNFLIFVLSMAAFDVFLVELSRSRGDAHDSGVRNASAGDSEVRPLPNWAMRAIGYSLCLYAGLVWISIGSVTPDQCVCVVAYSVAAMLLRMQREPTGWSSYVALGALLGFGYLTKAVLLPLGLISLAATPFLLSRSRPNERFAARFARPAVAACTFAMIAAPQVLALSRAKGRFTTGNTAKIAYAEMVDGVRRDGFWRGEGNLGTPKHPVRKLWDRPEVFEFAAPVGGTYPPWYDASYWLDGLAPRVDIGGQFRALGAGVRSYGTIAIDQLGFIVAVPVLCGLDWKGYSYRRCIASLWPAWIAPVAGLGIFSLVLVETRYVAGFLVIVALSFVAAIRLRLSPRTQSVVLGLTLAVVALNLLGIVRVAPRNIYSSVFRPQNAQWDVAKALAEQGILPGDRMATILDHRPGDYWAHLAQVKIVEDIPLSGLPELSMLDEASRARLVRLMRGPGVEAIVATPASARTPCFHWRRLGNTEYFVASLRDVDRR
jgi:hypothetical protein